MSWSGGGGGQNITKVSVSPKDTDITDIDDPIEKKGSPDDNPFYRILSLKNNPSTTETDDDSEAENLQMKIINETYQALKKQSFKIWSYDPSVVRVWADQVEGMEVPMY